MPAIPIYQQRVAASGPTQFAPMATPDTRGFEAVGQALGSVADDALAIRLDAKKREEENAAVWAQEAAMSHASKWVERFPALKEQAAEDGAGFAAGALKEFDDGTSEVLQQARTATSRAWLQQQFGRQRLALQQESQAFELQRSTDFRIGGLKRATDAARISAMARPQDFDTLRASQLAAIEASGLTAQTRAMFREESSQAIGEAAVRGLIERDPYGTLKDLQQEKPSQSSVAALSYQQRLLMSNAAQAEINRRESEAKAKKGEMQQVLSEQLGDLKEAAVNGMAITGMPSRGVLVAAFGEQKGGDLYQQALSYAALSPQVAKLYTAPVNEIAATVQAFRPTQQEGAKDQFALMGIVQQKAAEIVKQREADAGGYLVSYSPTVKAAWDEFQQSAPQDSEDAATAYLRSVRAEKDRLGIASRDVLPDAYADAVVDRLTRPQGGEGLAVAMASEAQRWGAAWPEVYRQVSKKLPDAALVIGSGIPKRAADTLALMSQKTKDEMDALIPAGASKKQVEDDIAEELAEFTSTFGPEGATVLTAVRNSAVHTAIGYMPNSSYKDAIRQAANDIANARYHFSEFRGQSYRVPVEFDADLIDDGASYFLRDYTQAIGTVQVPTGSKEDVILAQASDHIRGNGYWRTAPDESGLRLYVGTAAVPGVGGAPVQLTWEQLQDLARESAAVQSDARERAKRQRLEGAPGAE